MTLMLKIYNYFEKQKIIGLHHNKRSPTIALPADTLIDIFRFLPRKVLSQRIQAANSVIFRLCNSDKVPNIHLIQLIILEATTKENGSSKNKICLNPMYDSLDITSFFQMPLSAASNIRFVRVVLAGQLSSSLVDHLAKMRHMFTGSRLEIVHSLVDSNATHLLKLFGKNTLSECAILYDNCEPSSLRTSFLLGVILLSVNRLEIMQLSEDRRNIRLWETFIVQDLIEWLHHDKNDSRLGRHLILQESTFWDTHLGTRISGRPFWQSQHFIEEIIKRFQKAVRPCNFVITFSPDTNMEAFDIFNHTTNERMSLFQREGEAKLFRLWRRSSTLESFLKSQLNATNIAVGDTIFAANSHFYRVTPVLKRSLDISKLPLVRKTTKRFGQLQYLSRDQLYMPLHVDTPKRLVQAQQEENSLPKVPLYFRRSSGLGAAPCKKNRGHKSGGRKGGRSRRR
ncbi:hypothetical protein Ddc_11634 [Ditylenchus destructor]|nr:hypothetical protein Ddc_11634 [Ditylenchus destructor]